MPNPINDNLWVAIGGITNKIPVSISSLVCLIQLYNLIYITLGKGLIQISQDNGMTWKNHDEGMTSNFEGLITFPATNQFLLSTDAGIYASSVSISLPFPIIYIHIYLSISLYINKYIFISPSVLSILPTLGLPILDNDIQSSSRLFLLLQSRIAVDIFIPIPQLLSISRWNQLADITFPNG